MTIPPSIIPLCVALAFTGCAPAPLSEQQVENRAAAELLKQAGVITTPTEARAALYLGSAAESYANLDAGKGGDHARTLYNQATTGLTVLLRSADNGRLWNRRLTLTSGTTTYHLRFAAGTRDGIWEPNYFTTITAAASVPDKSIHHRNRQDGVGGALVGVHKTQPLEAFSPKIGVTAPVTATLNFKGHDATLTLLDPGTKPKAPLAGTARTLDADFSAPLAYYPNLSEWWNGIMGALRVNAYMSTTGLYMLQPYNPDRIPLVFVHGLISTARMWRSVINEVESDPTLRGRYQCMVFAYPTGNPPAYSALRLREELAKFRKLHPQTRGYVLVGHSMGGLISHMQTTTVTRETWNIIGKNKASKFFKAVKKGSLVDKAVVFDANPHVSRVVFICTPHRGSEMALSRLGELGRRLISLPLDLTSTITGSLVEAIAMVTGSPKGLPNSVSGLAPTNPMLKVLDTKPISAPHHSIIGDCGKGDTPNSTDGVVKYWSSHLSGALSEKIVPGPHGACELPETIAELRRILHLHLKANPAGR
jgi:hypothetical protein